MIGSIIGLLWVVRLGMDLLVLVCLMRLTESVTHMDQVVVLDLDLLVKDRLCQL